MDKFTTEVVNINHWRKEVVAEIQRCTGYINEDLKNMSSSFCKLGFHLWELKYSGFLCYKNEKTINDINFYEYVKEVFGISKSTCNNYIRVCELFSHGNTMHMFLDDRYKDYNLSQLVEMASLDRDKWRLVNPNMTVRQIKAIKQLSDSYESIDQTTGQNPDDVDTEVIRDSFVNIYRQRTAHNLEDDLMKCLTSSIKNVDKVNNLVQFLNDFWQSYGE